MARRIAITGAAGQLGRRLVEVFGGRGDEILALSRPDFDITRASDLRQLASWQPDVVVNSAAWTDVDGCARDPARAMRINGDAAGAVAEATVSGGGLPVQISSNEVFDGTLERPYTEQDPPNPINPYGASKLAGERLVVAAAPHHLIVRTAWLFDEADGSGFPGKIRAAASRAQRQGEPLRVVADEWGNPTPVAWLAQAIATLVEVAERDESAFGIYHVVGEPAVSRLEWAKWVLRGGGVRIEPIALAAYRRDSRVPPRALLDPARARSRGVIPADWRASSDVWRP